jgi:hypothetical protein
MSQSWSGRRQRVYSKGIGGEVRIYIKESLDCGITS